MEQVLEKKAIYIILPEIEKKAEKVEEKPKEIKKKLKFRKHAKQHQERIEINKIRNVLVVGAGTMGHAIAQVYAQNGFNVSLVDLNQKKLEHAVKLIKSNLRLICEQFNFSKFFRWLKFYYKSMCIWLQFFFVSLTYFMIIYL